MIDCNGTCYSNMKHDLSLPRCHGRHSLTKLGSTRMKLTCFSGALPLQINPTAVRPLLGMRASEWSGRREDQRSLRSPICLIFGSANGETTGQERRTDLWATTQKRHAFAMPLKGFPFW